MKRTKIRPYSRWIYKGEGEGKGELHRVVFLNDKEIITVGESSGFCGTPKEFVKVFAAT